MALPRKRIANIVESTAAPAAPVPHVLSDQFSDADLVDRIFEFIVKQFPEIAERATSVKDDFRGEFGGEERYIAKRPPTERQRRVAEVLRLFNGRNASEVARVLKIGRATVYRILKQEGGQ